MVRMPGTGLTTGCNDSATNMLTHMLTQTLTQSPDGEVLLGPSGVPIWANPATTLITGFSHDECLAMPDFPCRFIYPNDRPLFDAMVQSVASSGQASQAHLRLMCKGQDIHWVTMTWQPVHDEAGKTVGTRVGMRDMSLMARTTSSPINHLQVYRHLAASISKQARLQGHDLTSLCNYVVKSVAVALDVKRVGVWLFNAPHTELQCVSLFDAGVGQHVPMPPIPVSAYPVYMRAIAMDDLIVAHDALAHELTRELGPSYLTPLGITSMLDAPIQQSGTTAGVLCIEHGPGTRQWAVGEGAFADALAEMIGQYLEAQERTHLQALSQRLVSIIDTTPDLVFTATLQGEVVYLNPSGRRLLGVGLNEPLHQVNAIDFVPPEWREQRVNLIIPHILKHGSWSGEVSVQDLEGNTFPAWEYFLGHRNADQRIEYISGVVRDLRKQKTIEQELRQREASLKQLNDELEARVMDRTRQLEEVNSNLETFAFSVSHDLKAPLRGIDGYSRLLADEYRHQLPADAQGFIDNIRQAANSMSQLIDDLLTYSRLGRRELSSSKFSIRAAIDRILTERQHDLQTHHVHLDNQVQDLMVEVDLECFLQLMRNFIDNAIKFSSHQPDPRITLHSETREGELIMGVKDNGCGFDMKYHQRIFTIFQRLHRSQDYPGTGVGLAIAHKAAERMQGRVWASSSPGTGATFFLALPDFTVSP
jgi:PAS domain S-box-containing protein